MDELRKPGLEISWWSSRKFVATGRGLDIVNRRENIEALVKLGLTKKNLREEIMILSVEDYCEGPEPDRNRLGDIWVFGKQIGGQEIYIKLKIAQVGDVKIAKCISFHAANFPLRYPCRDEERREEG